MPALEIHPEDQYAVVPAAVTLAELDARLPANLHYRAPNLSLPVGDWVLAGGVGLLEAPPVRRDVLGLRYDAGAGIVEAGGRVVKNVSGYDLVRLLVASDAALERRVALHSVTLRLRPRPSVARRGMEVSEAGLAVALEGLRGSGAAFAYAYRVDGGLWRVCGEWWDANPTWGRPLEEAMPDRAVLRDLTGAFPRAPRQPSELEAQILAAL